MQTNRLAFIDLKKAEHYICEESDGIKIVLVKREDDMEAYRVKGRKLCNIEIK